MGVWKRMKNWMTKLKARVGKVGVWKRLDLASLKRTEGTQAKKQWEEAEARGGSARGAGMGVRRRTGGIRRINGGVWDKSEDKEISMPN